MAGKIILLKDGPPLYNDPTNNGAITGGVVVTLPDGSQITVGGANGMIISFQMVVTCEDDGTGTGNTAEFCRLVPMSPRFAKPAGW